MPLEVMAHLAWRGVRPDQAADAITRAVAGGATTSQLIALDASVRQDVESGVAPPEALSARTRYLTLQLQAPLGRSSPSGAAEHERQPWCQPGAPAQAMSVAYRFAIVALLAALVPGESEAQPPRNRNERLHDVSVDVGGLALRRRDEPWRNAVSVVPHWRAATDEGALFVGGAVSGTQNGYESAYGTLGLELTPQTSRAKVWISTAPRPS